MLGKAKKKEEKGEEVQKNTSTTRSGSSTPHFVNWLFEAQGGCVPPAT